MVSRGMGSLLRGVASCAVLAWAVGHCAPALAAETLRVNGSGIALDLMKPLAAAYQKLHPDVRIEMEKPLGSSGAIKALLAGALDLVVSSKRLTPEQAAQGAQAQEYGKTPLAVVVERSVPKADVTTRELEEIYSLKLSAWANGERVRVVVRPDTDIDTAILRGLSPGMGAALDIARAHPGVLMAVTDPESNDAVARTPGGVGASGLPGVLVNKLPLRVLSLNGVPPTVKALADGSYPLAKDIRFVTKGPPSPAVRELVTFALSPQGRAIAEKAGVLVAPEAPAPR